MQRTKVFAVAAALVSAAVAAVLLTGGASAATWHVYSGDMFAGHAYALQVPEGAQSVEFVFDGAESGKAELGVYAPDGKRAGFYELASTLTAASIANPASGRYVVYVYDVVDGALTVRVDAEDAPAKLDLAEVELVRQETKIGSFTQGPLDQRITSKLQRETVFVTLLYQGSSTDLDATVSSSEGAVVTIVDETATAFSPGVWTTLAGTRTFDASMLAGTTYDVEVHAAKFEGTMVLTTLALKIDMPTPIRVPHEHAHPGVPAQAPTPPAPPAFGSGSAQFTLEEGEPIAFVAAGPTTLLLADPAALDEDEDGNASYHDDCQPLHGVVAIYTPSDELLAIVELSHEEATVAIELPAAGEYVAYARHVEGDMLLGKLAGQSHVAVRPLEVGEEIVRVEPKESKIVELANVPLDLALGLDGLGALSSVELANEKGTVARADPLVVAPGADFLAWTYVEAENFAAGEHTLSVSGAFDGAIEIRALHYLRAPAAPEAEADADAEKAEAEEEAEEPAPEEESWLPLVPDVRDLVPGLPW